MVDRDKTVELIGWVSRIPPLTRTEIVFETTEEVIQWVGSMVDSGAIVAEDIFRVIRKKLQ